MQEKNKEDFLDKLNNFQGLAELKHRPIYLAMLGFISQTQGHIPDTRAEAYEKITEAYIFMLEQKKKLDKSIVPNWKREDRVDFLSEFAYSIHTTLTDKADERQQLHIVISHKEMYQIFKNILEKTAFSTMDNKTDTKELYKYFLGRTGLLMEPKEGFVQFSHLSFQEYLVAKRIHRRQPKRNIEKYLKKEILS